MLCLIIDDYVTNIREDDYVKGEMISGYGGGANFSTIPRFSSLELNIREEEDLKFFDNWFNFMFNPNTGRIIPKKDYIKNVIVTDLKNILHDYIGSYPTQNGGVIKLTYDAIFDYSLDELKKLDKFNKIKRIYREERLKDLLE